MADREFVFDGSPTWSVDHAIRVLEANGGTAAVREALAMLEVALLPAPRDWLGDRLSVLWTMFMASRSVADDEVLTVWLSEHMRLLGDLPHDVVAIAVDRAVQTARHGFLPSIGEVRAIADPLVSDRRRQVDRLRQTVTVLGDPEAIAERTDRRTEAAWRQHD